VTKAFQDRSLHQQTDLVTISEIRAAAAALPPVVRNTPLWPAACKPGEIGKEKLFLKLENLQSIGAFKVRAAFAAVASLTFEQRAKGIVIASSGNFAQAFALAGQYYSSKTVAVMLATTSSYKIESTRALGAEVDLFSGDALDRQKRVDEIGVARGMTVIDTWEDPAIIAGHGSIGLEIISDLPNVEQILVPVSSGGLAAGVAAAVKSIAPHVEVIGVQPVSANAAYLSMSAGRPVAINDWSTIADGLSARRPGERPFAHLQHFLDRIVLVQETDIAKAFIFLRDKAKVLAEPAGAVATAAYLAGLVDTEKSTAAVLSGGNLTHQTMRTLETLAAEK
jgi:threonine dehydratase